MDKASLRRQGLAGRRGMSAARRAECDRAIAQAVAASGAFAAAAVVMAYCRAGSEADVSALAALARAQGKAVVYPHCTARTEMEALLPEADGAFVTDCNGMRSPDPARAARIDPERIDLVLLPCAAFDSGGNRIGMGAGCYDRFLRRCTRAQTVLIAYEAQRVARIDPDPTDVPARQIATERGCFPAR